MVEELDFPYPYTHQMPFPDHEKIDRSEVIIAFRAVFDRAAGFLA